MRQTQDKNTETLCPTQELRLGAIALLWEASGAQVLVPLLCSTIPRRLSLSTEMGKREVEATLFIFKEILFMTQNLDTWPQTTPCQSGWKNKGLAKNTIT